MRDAFWTNEREAILIKCVDLGLSASVAGVMLKCSRNAAIAKASRIGIRFASSTNPRLCKRVEPTAEQMSDIARAAAEASQPRAEVETFFDTPPDVDEPAPEGGVPIWELGAFHCRSILNGTTNAETLRYCGQPTVGGSWCAEHAKAYLTPAPRAVRAGRWA